LERPASVPEEIANSVSHGLGSLASLAVVPVLISAAAERGKIAGIVGASVFAVTMMLVYSTSTIYHALPHNRAKRLFRVLDHAAIFLLIAGTYTPFTLGVLAGGWGFTLFGLVWALAIFGVVLKAVGGVGRERLSTGLYIGMGWLVLPMIWPLWQAMPAWGLFWLAAGGIAYTAGVGFYAAKRLRYGHLIWHLFVMAGTSCHVVAVTRYAG
jgi:hemolysin III